MSKKSDFASEAAAASSLEAFGRQFQEVMFEAPPENLPEAGEKSSPTSLDVAKRGRGQALARAAQRGDRRAYRYEAEEVSKMLSAVSADCDRMTWLRIGFALCEWDEVEGCRLWQEWSATGGGRHGDEAETQRAWESEVVASVNSDDAAYRFDIDGLANLAREHGWRPPTMIPGKNGGRAKVFLSDGDGQRNANDVVKDCLALLRAEGTFYLHNGEIVRVLPDPRDGAKMLRPTVITATSTLCELADWFVGPDQIKDRRRGPPKGVVELLVAAPVASDSLPNLVGIASVPYIDAEGRLHSAPGYDAANQVYLAPHGLDVVVTLPDEVEALRASAADAYRQIRDLFEEVPIQTELHRAAYASLIMTVCLPPAIEPVLGPFFLLEANVSRAGKTFCALSAGVISTGRRPATTSAPNSEEEWSKTLLSLARRGCRLCILDNIKSELGGSALEAAVTSSRISGRLLGESQTVEYDFAPTWIATLNNGTLSSDMVNRSIHIYIESPHANTSSAVYKWSDEVWFRDYLPSQRSMLISAICTLQLAYIRAGRPSMPAKNDPLGAWRNVVAGPLWFATGFCVMDTREGLRETADEATAEMLPFLGAFPEGKRFTSHELTKYGKASPPDDEAFSDALDQLLGSRRIELAAKTVTSKLKPFKGRPIPLQGHTLVARLRQDKDGNDRAVWSVQRKPTSSG